MATFTLKQAFDTAVQCHQAGQLSHAEMLYRQILAENSQHPGALHYLGVIANQVGQNDIAVDLIRQAIRLEPSNAEAYSNLGIALKQKEEFDEAIAAYHQAIALKPNYPAAHNNLGNALTEKGRFDEAIAAYRQAIAFKPDYFEAHSNLGSALIQMDQLNEGVAACRRAIALNSQSAEAHRNLGTALLKSGQPDRATAAYQRAVALKADYPEAHNDLGLALEKTGRLDEGVAAFRRAITLKPDFDEAYNNLGSALKDEGNLDEAIAAYRQALAINPTHAASHSNLIYTLYFHPSHDAQTIAGEQRCWNLQHAAPLSKLIEPHHNDRRADRRLRVGYLSPDFRQHVVGQNLLPLFEQHDHRQFEIICYAQVPRRDAVTGQFQQNADGWRNIVGLSDDQVVAQIRQDRIDILVDLTLHMAGNRLLVFARKPAPVQVTFAGYPGSTGLNTIDYRLSDPYLDPPGMDESIYSEQTIRLPDAFWCYNPLGSPLAVNDLPAASDGFVTFGCLNNFCKTNVHLLKLWASVMREAKHSRLVLLAPIASVRQRTLQVFQSEGIEAPRIQFEARRSSSEYLRLYHQIDLVLDSFPYNGHTTSLDALWMGVPVVTLAGKTAVSRAGVCQLTNLGLPELIADTAERYVRIAAELANDLPRLTALRSTLRQRMERSPLMNASKFARNIEAAYRHMWRTWCA
jgi:predicted O-linked N-acetylglucosamine transferase (SPINDLY family)